MSKSMLARQRVKQAGFFDLDEPNPFDRARKKLAATAASVDDLNTFEVLHKLYWELEGEAGVYTLSRRDATHINLGLEMPDQPEYDWTNVIDDEV